MKSEFQDRLAVVTGASSGIGLALCAALLQRGARVLAMSRSLGGLETMLETHAEQLQWLQGDVTSADDLARLARRAAQLGTVHYLVPNAGIAELADGLDMAAFDRQWAVNGAGALNTFAALRNELAKPASVVFIGTFLIRSAFPGLGLYRQQGGAGRADAHPGGGIRTTGCAPEHGVAGADRHGDLGHAGAQRRPARSGRRWRHQAPAAGAFPRIGGGGQRDSVPAVPGARGVFGQDWVVDNGYTIS